MGSGVEVIDSALDLSAFQRLESLVMSDYFSWYYNYAVVNFAENEPLWSTQFTHVVYRDFKILSESWDTVLPLIERLNPSALVRSKFNSTNYSPTIHEHGFHQDSTDTRHQTAILYMNDCDGYTKFKNTGEIVESRANRLVVFPSLMFHTGTTCTNAKRRVVLNTVFV